MRRRSCRRPSRPGRAGRAARRVGGAEGDRRARRAAADGPVSGVVVRRDTSAPARLEQRRGSGGRRRPTSTPAARRRAPPAAQTRRAGREHLAAARVDHGHAAGERLERRDARDRHAERRARAPRAVARPMRIHVKLPGPRADHERARSSRRVVDELGRSPRAGRRPGPLAARPPDRGRRRRRRSDVAVSKAKVVFTLDPDARGASRRRGSGYDRARPREPGAAVLGPLDEGNRAIEVRLEVAPILRVEPGEPVEVEMRDRRRRLVAVADRERRARDRPD